MTTLQSEDCHTDNLNDLFPMSTESLRFPLDNSMRIVFTGYYNGFNVEVRSQEEVSLLYHMGCFGKGSSSRSQPAYTNSDNDPQIMRKRQYLKRNYWYKKFGNSQNTSEAVTFLKDLDELNGKILCDSEKLTKKDIIDLVSSDEENEDETEECSSHDIEQLHSHDKEDIVVIVPNSDSEDEDYFLNLKPKCCISKIRLQEKLILSPEEAFFLVYGLGCFQVVSTDNRLLSIEKCWTLFTSHTDFVSKYIVYHYFRSKGYVVKPGVKFGGDYLLYKDGPCVSHADYIVVIKSDIKQDDWISILGHVRMATTTVKEVLIVEIIKPTKEVIKLPEELNLYKVREVLLTRDIPNIINNYDYRIFYLHIQFFLNSSYSISCDALVFFLLFFCTHSYLLNKLQCTIV